MNGNTQIRCLVIDDEPPAQQIMEKYIRAVPSLHLSGTCANAVDALSVLQKEPIDLIFLDIQMPFILGTDFIRTLSNAPKVIFTTAYRKFAVEGFDLDAVDYLLKPISFERFLKAVNKVHQLTAERPTAQPAPEKRQEPFDQFIHFKVDKKMIKLSLDDILYVESLKDYIKLVTRQKTYVTKQSISSLEEMLPPDLFARIHRSFIVSLNKIESYTAEMIEIAKQELPVSRMYRHELKKILKLN